ncbi:miraculin-like [Neltuma alba]|uniref:miraculin-like n=1 Tax=Neltuma alba TaxID=207710 RepID=UPI0010A56495|nr:miraculin-like [Prosopis alba]
MKITRTLVAFVLLFALSIKPLLGGAANAEPEPVLDSGGTKLRADRSYYIIPVPAPPSGGLEVVRIGKKCPPDVITVQEDPSLPSLFIPIDPKKGEIHVSTDLNIKFSVNTHTGCPHSSNVWRLDDYDNTTGQYFVTTGGVVGNPGRQTVRNWFKIEKYEDAYKLVYCPTVCGTCKVQCKDVGTYIDSHGYEHLALSDVPYKIQFL